MENCLGDLHLNWCIIYLDDIMIYSKTLEEHMERLKAVFKKPTKAGLKLKPSKCKFFKSEITYLGHIVSNEGIAVEYWIGSTNPVCNWTCCTGFE